VGKSQVRGFLNMHTEASIEEAYALAVADVVEKMQADTTLQARMNNQAKSSTAESTPCGMVTLFPTKKIRAMSF
jgi:hypothetical protein